jgi:serine/threonine protein kinase
MQRLTEMERKMSVSALKPM